MDDDDSNKLTLEEVIGKPTPKYYEIEPWQFVFGIGFVLILIILVSFNVWSLLNETGN